MVLQARAHLLNVGIVRPRDDVTAIDINSFLSRPEGAPPSVGKITDADKIDVARFLNRYAAVYVSLALVSICSNVYGKLFWTTLYLLCFTQFSHVKWPSLVVKNQTISAECSFTRKPFV